MLKRLITGLCYIAVIVGMFFLREVDVRLFNILIFAFCILGTFEMVRALGEKITVFQRCVVLAYALALAPIFAFFGITAVAVLTFSAATLICSTLVFEFEKVDLDMVGCSLLAMLYPSGLLIPLMLINVLPTYSFIALLLVFIISPISDTFAYVVGITMGKRKFSPKISPNKTIAGAVGGIIGGAIGAIVCWAICARGVITDVVWQEVLLFSLAGLIGSALTEFGDLTEGAIKRKLGIKDMGKILPGHGGILDRIDGTIFAAIFMYLFFTLLS